MIESRLVQLEQRGLVASDPDGWALRTDPTRPAPTGPDTYVTNFGPMSVLVQDGMAESRRLEGWGLHLAQTTIRRLRGVVSEDERVAVTQPVLGPEFDYSSSPTIFNTRTGTGPLYIAWDTNLLIDYFDYGAALWRGGQLPDSLQEGDNYETLEGLELLLALSVVRDIRMVLLPHIPDDFRKKLSELDDLKKEQRKAQTRARLQALDRFEAAMSLVGSGEPDGDEISQVGLEQPPLSDLEEALQFVPAGGDRQLVRQAVEQGVHVFLTKDKGVLKAADRLTPFGLHITHTQELLEEMCAAGAYNCLLAPETMYWPLPDQQRVANLIQSLPITNL